MTSATNEPSYNLKTARKALARSGPVTEERLYAAEMVELAATLEDWRRWAVADVAMALCALVAPVAVTRKASVAYLAAYAVGAARPKLRRAVSVAMAEQMSDPMTPDEERVARVLVKYHWVAVVALEAALAVGMCTVPDRAVRIGRFGFAVLTASTKARSIKVQAHAPAVLAAAPNEPWYAKYAAHRAEQYERAKALLGMA